MPQVRVTPSARDRMAIYTVSQGRQLSPFAWDSPIDEDGYVSIELQRSTISILMGLDIDPYDPVEFSCWIEENL